MSLLGVPGGGQLWRISKTNFLVYRTPNGGDPIAYRLTNQEARDLFEDGRISHSRTFATLRDAQRQTGMIEVGVRTDLRSTAEHPFSSLSAKFERLAVSQPWLRDPEVLALHSSALLEGRSITEAELQSTEWFQTRTRSQREWAQLSMADPMTAEQISHDNRLTVVNTLRELGVNWVPDSNMGRVVDFVTAQWTTGSWSQAYTTEQLRRMADPSRGELDKALKKAAKKSFWGHTREKEDHVKDLVSQWLGPHVAANWSERMVKDWAGRLRNNPDSEQELVESLRHQRLAKYQAYGDQNTTYADIDALWRPVVRSVWGEDPEHDDAIYQKILQLNDSAAAEKLLRQEGVKRGNRQVGLELLSGLHDATGGSVRAMR